MDSHDIMVALSGQAMNTYTPEDFLEVVRIQVDRAYTLAEVQRPDADVYHEVVKEVADKILRSYGYITSQEMALVCEAGVAGELGRQTRPTAGAIFSWLAAYYGSDLRKEAIQTRRRQLAATRPDSFSGEDLDRANWEATIRAIGALWQEYRLEGRILDDHQDGFCHIAFEGIMERNMFTLSRELWEDARREARSQYRRQNGVRTVGDIVNGYTPQFRTERILLGRCFQVAVEKGIDIAAKLRDEVERKRQSYNSSYGR